MKIADRIPIYQGIEAYRKRPLIVYATSTRQGVPAILAGDAVRELIDQIEQIPAQEKRIDVLINSSGGDPLAAWRLMASLRERFEKVGVLVPFHALSAATIFSLGADEIVMHANASLGPIDPQIPVRDKDGSVKFYGYEDIMAFGSFLTDDIKLTDQPGRSGLLPHLFSVVDPLAIGNVKRASDLSAEVGERLLSTHLKDPKSAKQIATNLNKSFFFHGDAITRKRARELKLPIADPDARLEKLIWEAFSKIEEHMELRIPLRPTNPLPFRSSRKASGGAPNPGQPPSRYPGPRGASDLAGNGQSGSGSISGSGGRSEFLQYQCDS